MKFLKYSLAVLVVVFFSSCDLLEDREPQQSLEFPGQLETAVQVENTLTGAYNDIQDGDFTGAQTLVFNEIIADNTSWTGSFTTYQQIAVKDMDSSNGSIEGVWNDGYDAINTANIILASLPNIDDPDLNSDRIEGEAKFIRALSHFALVKLFAESPYVAGQTNDQLGVPVRTEPTTSPQDFDSPSRNSVEEVYNAVIADLQDAISLLPSSSANGTANSFVASALLSRVFMQQGEYESARDLAADVIAGPYRLNNNVETFFRNEFSPESIFEIAHTLDDNPGVNTALPAFYNQDARDDIQLSTDYIAAAGNIVTDDQQAELDANNQTAEDTRITVLTSAPSLEDANTSETTSTKYESAANVDDNAPILRLPEMMFNYMEAQARLATDLASVPQDVFDQLNQIRTRAFIVRNADGDQIPDESAIEYERADFTDKQELIDTILLERRIELAFEGQRLGDLQRLQQDITGLPFDDPNIAFPIPQDEIDANDNITQNPAYQ